MSILLNSGTVGHVLNMNKEELEIYNKKLRESWAKLEKTYTRIVLIEKYETLESYIKRLNGKIYKNG